MEKLKKCFECEKVRNISRFPKPSSGLNSDRCDNCRLRHRLQPNTNSYYPSTDERDEDYRLTLDSELDSIYGRDR